MKPMDTAVYWVEYVIRNGGEQFKSDALEQHWYQRVMLDVLFAFALGLISLLYITKILLRNLTISRVHKEDSKKTR